MTEYFATEFARCPACQEVNPGHVFGDSRAGVYGWNCPACGHTADPSELDTTNAVPADETEVRA